MTTTRERPDVHAPAAVAPVAPAVPAPFSRLPTVRRPDPALLTYYGLSSLALGPFFFAMLIPLYFKYRSLRYTVEEEGITMRWGVLFRREVSLTYARIQDIHLTSNFVERWLGLARVQVQTASGSSSAEMTIEGLKDFGAVRDFLYARMRGARDRLTGHGAAGEVASGTGEAGADQLAETLREIAAEVRGIRRALAAGGGEEVSDV